MQKETLAPIETENRKRMVVQVDGDDLIVFLPGTDYIATFYRATPGELLAKSHAGHEVGDAPMTFAEFQGRAWQAANDKARELGWIACCVRSSEPQMRGKADAPL